MTSAELAPTTSGRMASILALGLLIVVAAMAAASGSPLRASPSSAPATPISSSKAAPPIDAGRSARRDALGEGDGLVPDGTTVFDDEIPGVANLDPALLGALRKAAPDAREDGVELFVNSGWRSAAYQEQLLRDAVAKYGSEKIAERWVGTPDTSAHVSGDAVDIASSAALRWLSRNGARYGLCQIYRNEPWHYELRPDATHRGCPAMYADPTHDPRMRP